MQTYVEYILSAYGAFCLGVGYLAISALLANYRCSKMLAQDQE